jgi:hypothetical protein
MLELPLSGPSAFPILPPVPASYPSPVAATGPRPDARAVASSRSTSQGSMRSGRV